MADFIRYTVEDKVAVLVIDHPPVNALNEQTLKELSEAIDALNADPGREGDRHHGRRAAGLRRRRRHRHVWRDLQRVRI